jgi:hypothetical protein
MLTRRIDAALSALAECQARLPALRDVFRVGAPEHAALNELILALKRTDDLLHRRAGSGED